MKILIIAEHDNHTLKTQTLNVVAAASKLSGEVTVAVLGHNATDVANQVASVNGVSQVLSLDSERFAHLIAEDAVEALIEYAKGMDMVMAPATTFGKNLMPRLSALLDVACHSDVTELLSNDTFKRPIYAGNIIQTVKALDTIKCMTIRTTAFEKAATTDNVEASIDSKAVVLSGSTVSFVSLAESKSERPELTAANVVVSGGRALASAENFKLIEDLADTLNGAVGASRAAVDAGYVQNDYQVGQTGKVVAPALYIAIGISGAIQHMAGMKDSKVIVAINKDEDAPIFQIADYGLKGDLFTIVPELIEKLKG